MGGGGESPARDFASVEFLHANAPLSSTQMPRPNASPQSLLSVFIAEKEILRRGKIQREYKEGVGRRWGTLDFPPPFLTKRQNQTRNHRGEGVGERFLRSLEALLGFFSCWGCNQVRKLVGRVCVCVWGESLQAKLGRKLEVAFLATTNINNNNKKRSPPSTLRLLRVPSPESGGWERGSTTPPRSFSNGGTWSRPALCTFSSFSFPLSPSTLHLFFLTHFFCFFLSFFFFLTFFSVFFFVCFFVFFFPSLLSCLLALLLPGPRSLQ